MVELKDLDYHISKIGSLHHAARVRCDGCAAREGVKETNRGAVLRFDAARATHLLKS